MTKASESANLPNMYTPGQAFNPADLENLAWRAFQTHASLLRMEHYTGVLSLHGLARLAVRTGEPAYLEQARRHFQPFIQDRMIWNANFPLYFCGGAGAAYLYHNGRLREAGEAVLRRADEQDRQPRDKEGLFSHPKKSSEHIWIDTVFAVTPFYLYAGLAFDRQDWVDEAVRQALGHYNALRCEETGLLFQCRDFLGPGKLSRDHWSRGNGWGLHGMAALVQDLPGDHPRRSEVETLFVEHLQAALQYRGPEGLWRQEMTEPKAYIETSGSMLILQALGAAIEKGLLDPSHKSILFRGLREGTNYMSPDGSIFNCCPGCLCPHDGGKLAYMARGPVLNDAHAFGPYVHAFEQALPLL